MDSSRPKPERMEETLEGGRGPPRAVAPLEEEEEEEEGSGDRPVGSRLLRRTTRIDVRNSFDKKI